MEIDGKKIALISGVAIVLGFSLWSMVKYIPDARKGDFINDRTDMPLKCTHPGCGVTYKLSGAEFKELFHNPKSPVMPGQEVFPCRVCGRNTATVAQECEKCTEVFIMNHMSLQQGSYPDKCPRCGYSTIEEKLKN